MSTDRSFPAWKANPTQPTRRDQVRVGDVVHSSHGFRFEVTEVQDNAVNRTDERHIGLRGRMHASPTGAMHTERYPAGSMVPVETEDLS